MIWSLEAQYGNSGLKNATSENSWFDYAHHKSGQARKAGVPHLSEKDGTFRERQVNQTR